MNRSKAILAITAVMVVLWSNTALGSNGDPVRAGQTTTATARTTLSTNQANGEGLKVVLSGATAGAAIRGQNGAKGNGVTGLASKADAYGVSGSNTAVAHGAGAGGFFNGRNNNGVVGTTDDADSAGVEGSNSAFGGDGVEGHSANGNGVFGTTSSTDFSGVYGETTVTGGSGVFGTAGNGGIGVHGTNTGTGDAGRFDGTVRVNGGIALSGILDCTGCVLPRNVAGFIQGQAVAMGAGSGSFFGPPFGSFLRLSYDCPASLANSGTLHIMNASGQLANVFVESGTPNPSYFQMAAGGDITFPASATADSFHIQAQGFIGILTIEVATVHRASDCHVQAQGVLAV